MLSNPTDVFLSALWKIWVFCALCLAGLHGLQTAWVCLLTADFFCCSLRPDSFLLLLLHLSVYLVNRTFFPHSAHSECLRFHCLLLLFASDLLPNPDNPVNFP